MNEIDERCQTCGQIKELCLCEEASRETVVISEEPARYGKKLVVIEGVPLDQMEAIKTKLQKECATGGTIKKAKKSGKMAIKIQGGHLKPKIKKVLEELGFKVESTAKKAYGETEFKDKVEHNAGN